jgi:hypothetical protein
VIETVETTMRVGISGQFLNNKQNFSQISRLFAELSSSTIKLQQIEAHLWDCNQPAWLNSFANRSLRRKRDCGKELTSLVQTLEGKKIALQSAIDETCAQLLQLEPSALDTKKTLAGTPFAFATPPVVKGRMKDPDVAVRNMLIYRHREKPCKTICGFLDIEFPSYDGRPATGMPPGIVEEFSVTTYSEAYRKSPQRIQTLISKHRKKSHLP